MPPKLTSVLSRVAIASYRQRYRTASGSDQARPVAITHWRRLRPQFSLRTPNLKVISSSISLHLGGFNMKTPNRNAQLLGTVLVVLAISLAVFAQDGARTPTGETYPLKEGTEVSLKFAQHVSSKT